jgi:hypothetical protein
MVLIGIVGVCTTFLVQKGGHYFRFLNLDILKVDSVQITVMMKVSAKIQKRIQ